MPDSINAGLRRELTLSAQVRDPFDGAIRILCDAQRFGFQLRELHLEPGDGGTSTMTLGLLVPAGTDAELIASRFSRHGTVVGLTQRDEGN